MHFHQYSDNEFHFLLYKYTEPANPIQWHVDDAMKITSPVAYQHLSLVTHPTKCLQVDVKFILKYHLFKLYVPLTTDNVTTSNVNRHLNYLSICFGAVV